MTQEYLKAMFEYLPSGHLKNRQTGNVLMGSGKPGGPLSIEIKGHPYRYHRVIWLYHHGHLPKMLDHINRQKRDNKIENLRPCTKSQNGANANRRRALPKGVYQLKNGFMAQIGYQMRLIYIGYFKTIKEAADAYDKKALELFGDFAAVNELR